VSKSGTICAGWRFGKVSETVKSVDTASLFASETSCSQGSLRKLRDFPADLRPNNELKK
jgi:hypothetical protein